MARVKRTRSRSRDFHREQQKPENRMLDTEQVMKERRERRQEQLKNDKRHQKRLAREAAAERRRARKEAASGEDGRPELSPHELKIRRRNRWIYALVLLIFLGFLGAAAWKAVRVKAQEAEAAAYEQHLREELERLKGELARVDDPEYIEEKARTELHMVFPGETLYIVNGRKTDDAADIGNAE